MIKLSDIKRDYIPLLAVYFAVGLSGLTSVVDTLFFKDVVNLPAETLIELSVYISLPWSIKMVFGTFIDSVSIFGSNRKAYIYLGQLLVALGMAGMIDNASSKLIFSYLGEYGGILFTGLLTTIGVVISDITADVMAIEVAKEEKELGTVQVLSRLALVVGGLAGAALTGFLASHFAMATVYTIALFCPLIAVVATSLVRYSVSVSSKSINKDILAGGVLYGLFVIFAGAYLGPWAVFIVSLGIISVMMRSLLREFPKEAVVSFVTAMIAIFLFRVVPGVGPASGWWYMNSLGFDAEFMGHLRIITQVAGLVALVGLSGAITSGSIFSTMLVLTVLSTIFSLPDILVYYGLTAGLSAKTVVMFDTALIAPLGQLAMIPLGVLVAKNAPKNARAVYIAVTASLMNISLVGGDLITKELNKVFIVTRTNFDHLGLLMIYSLVISTVLSVVGLILLRRTK